MGFGILTTRTRKAELLSFFHVWGIFAGLSTSISFPTVWLSLPIVTIPVPFEYGEKYVYGREVFLEKFPRLQGYNYGNCVWGIIDLACIHVVRVWPDMTFETSVIFIFSRPQTGTGIRLHSPTMTRSLPGAGVLQGS